jgi:hypothetical protein
MPKILIRGIFIIHFIILICCQLEIILTGLGKFPLCNIGDFKAAPASWQKFGGALMPIRQREAMWMSFSAREKVAVRIGAGKVNAISGL